MAIQQVSVFVQNKPGALSAICKLLAESGVDMRAMFISDTKEFSILRVAQPGERAYVVLRVTDIAAAEDILKKAGFLLITEQDIQNL